MYISNYTPAHIQILYVCMCYVYDALEISPCLLLVYHALPRCLKIYSPVLLSLSHSLILHALTFAWVVAAIDCCNFCRFALFPFCVEGADAKATKHVCIPLTHTHTNCTNLCLYVCMHISTCSFLCAHPASWRLTSFGLLILRCFIDKEPRACACVRMCVCGCLSMCVYDRVNSFHLYFALINCDLISNTRSPTDEPRPACRRGVEQLKSKTKANGQCNHLATV